MMLNYVMEISRQLMAKTYIDHLFRRQRKGIETHSFVRDVIKLQPRKQLPDEWEQCRTMLADKIDGFVIYDPTHTVDVVRIQQGDSKIIEMKPNTVVTRMDDAIALFHQVSNEWLQPHAKYAYGCCCFRWQSLIFVPFVALVESASVTEFDQYAIAVHRLTPRPANSPCEIYQRSLFIEECGHVGIKWHTFFDPNDDHPVPEIIKDGLWREFCDATVGLHQMASHHCVMGPDVIRTVSVYLQPVVNLPLKNTSDEYNIALETTIDFQSAWTKSYMLFYLRAPTHSFGNVKVACSGATLVIPVEWLLVHQVSLDQQEDTFLLPIPPAFYAGQTEQLQCTITIFGKNRDCNLEDVQLFAVHSGRPNPHQSVLDGSPFFSVFFQRRLFNASRGTWKIPLLFSEPLLASQIVIIPLYQGKPIPKGQPHPFANFTMSLNGAANPPANYPGSCRFHSDGDFFESVMPFSFGMRPTKTYHRYHLTFQKPAEILPYDPRPLTTGEKLVRVPSAVSTANLLPMNSSWYMQLNVKDYPEVHQLEFSFVIEYFGVVVKFPDGSLQSTSFPQLPTVVRHFQE